MHSKKLFTHEDGSERRLRERKNTVFQKTLKRKKCKEQRRKQFDKLADAIRRRMAKGEEPEPDPGSLELFNDDLEAKLGNHRRSMLALPCKKASETKSSTVTIMLNKRMQCHLPVYIQPPLRLTYRRMVSMA